MRNTFKTNWTMSFVVPVATYGLFWIAFPRMFNVFVLRTQFHRSFRFAATLANTACVYAFINSFPFPNKQFHEVLTQPEPNGQYLRKVMKVCYSF
jgi:capsule polysaccharide modification protein KpsS